MGEYICQLSPKDEWNQLGAIDRLVITAIQTTQNNKGATVQELADATKRSTQDVLRIADTLVSQGLLTRDTDGLRGSVYCYMLTRDFSEFC